MVLRTNNMLKSSLYKLYKSMYISTFISTYLSTSAYSIYMCVFGLFLVFFSQWAFTPLKSVNHEVAVDLKIHGKYY